jgi:hypothetical protein
MCTSRRVDGVPGTYSAVGELAARGVRAIGIDLNPATIEAAVQRWPKGEFRVADATALPLDDGSVTGLPRRQGPARPCRARASRRRGPPGAGQPRPRGARRPGLGHVRDRLRRSRTRPHTRPRSRGRRAQPEGHPPIPQPPTGQRGSPTSPSRSTQLCGQTPQSYRCSPTSEVLGSTTKPPGRATIGCSSPSRSFSPPGHAPIEWAARRRACLCRP